MQNNIKNQKIIIMTTLGVIISIVLLTFGLWVNSFSHIPEMFKLNKKCQEQGYYMGEFEFKMVALLYWLDNGKYVKTITELKKYYKQLKTKEGLIKVPDFKNKEEEMQFYLSLQNPRTGAFMDDSFPFSSYTGPTGNVLEHLDALAMETGRKLKLKYPMKYLDEINTPDKLKAYLDDVSTIGWLGSKFSQTTFHNARDLLSLFHEDSTVEKWGLYDVTPEMKTALLEWFYKKQDPETGLWGPMDKKGKLIRKDTMNTASILKAFIDMNGNDIHKEFPLKYKDRLADSFLNIVRPLPEDDDLDDWHEWNLDNAKTLRTITRYLWKSLSENSRMRAREMMERFVGIKFRKFYIQKEGAFSYYPGSEHATLDGSGFIGDLKDFGYCSEEKQVSLWGGPEKTLTDKGEYNITSFSETDFNMNLDNINSMRFYAVNPESRNCIDNVLGVFYPHETVIPDVMELVPKMQTWIDGTTQSMGNWTSREAILEILSEIKIRPVPVLKEKLPVKELNDVLKKNKKLIIIGFDILQIPRFKIIYNLI